MIKFNSVTKKYAVGDDKVVALDHIDMEIRDGEFTVILGPSGSGKSTALNLLGGMDRASDGSVVIDGKNISQFSDKKLTDYRRETVGFIFQFYNLIPNLTAYENVGIAAQLTGNLNKADVIIEEVGLKHRKKNFPNQLSGGEMQRVAIARALAKSPRLLLCDEPTGALDSSTGRKILELLKDASNNKKAAVVVVTHNAAIAPMAHHVIHLQDGRIVEDTRNEHPLNVEEVVW